MSFEVIYIDKGYISNICRIQTFELTGFFGIYPLPGLKQREVFIYDLVLQIDLIFFRSICILPERPSYSSEL